ncbi:MAG TPA: glycosyltransferase [Gemmatales bacterium]|nr:glycosyltransferase [Gemmatales bacterium]
MKPYSATLGTAHLLHWLHAEGSPRLALSLVKEELLRTGKRPIVFALVEDVPHSIEPAFRELGIDVIYLGWNRDFGKLIFRVNTALKQWKPSGMICYSLGTHVSAGIACKWHGVPMLVHVGNAPSEDVSARRKLKLQLQVGRPFVRKHIACSHFVRDITIKAYGLPESSIVAVPNGIDLDRFQALRKERLQKPAWNPQSNRPLIIGMVASFEGHKDQESLLRTLTELKQLRIPAKLHLIGAGSKESSLKQLALKLGVIEDVVWVGNVPDVRPELLKMDVFAYCVTPQEGLGIALIEAMASGLPAVGADVGACQEVLDWGRHGPLIGNTDAKAWAKALIEMSLKPAVPSETLSIYSIKTCADSYFNQLYGSTLRV